MSELEHAPEFDKESIEKVYWDAILLDGKAPTSVFALCKREGWKESQFYDHFASLEAIESSFWQSMVDETIDVLKADDDFAGYDFRQKLLAFMYTYVAHIQQYRSRFVARFPKRCCCRTSASQRLRGMKHSFRQWFSERVQEGVAEGSIADRKKIADLYPKGVFEQFVAVIRFYCKDQSEKFQDTDALIEKSVAFAVDAMSSGVVDSAFDLLRFLLRETPFAKRS